MPDPLIGAPPTPPVDKTTESRGVPNVTVAMIGTADTSRLPDGTVATTPGTHEPNVVIQVVTPFIAILSRFGSIYFNCLSGFLIAATTTQAGAKLLGGREFSHTLSVCAGLALAPAVVGLTKDLVTIFGKLEGKFPLLTGSV